MDIRVDDLDPIARQQSVPTSLMCMMQALVDTWQGLSVNPRTCPREKMPRLCTYNAWFARPATIHCRTIFRLALSNKCMQTYIDPDLSVTICLGMWVAGLQCPGPRGLALSTILVSRAMSSIQCLCVRAYKIFVTRNCLDRMLGQWSSACGRLT